MMKEARYYNVCIQCPLCLIIGYTSLYFGLADSIYPHLFFVIIVLRRFINSGRYFVGIFGDIFNCRMETT